MDEGNRSTLEYSWNRVQHNMPRMTLLPRGQLPRALQMVKASLHYLHKGMAGTNGKYLTSISPNAILPLYPIYNVQQRHLCCWGLRGTPRLALLAALADQRYSLHCLPGRQPGDTLLVQPLPLASPAGERCHVEQFAGQTCTRARHRVPPTLAHQVMQARHGGGSCHPMISLQ